MTPEALAAALVDKAENGTGPRAAELRDLLGIEKRRERNELANHVRALMGTHAPEDLLPIMLAEAHDVQRQLRGHFADNPKFRDDQDDIESLAQWTAWVDALEAAEASL